MPRLKTNPVATLKSVQLFNTLDEKELAFLGQRIVQRHFKADQSVFTEGDPCAGLYLIEAGTVKLFVSAANGREQTLLIGGPGSMMGMLSVLDGGNYSASAKASTDTDLLLIRGEDLQALCLQHLEVGVKLLKKVASQVRPMIGIVEQLCFTTVRQRLARLLLNLAAQEGKATADGVELRLTSSRRDLAAQLGTLPELISRNLGSLQASGVIKVRGKHVIISDRKGLETEALSLG